MAVRLPAATVRPRKAAYLRKQPIRSGDNATSADEKYGLRGINSETNHAYAYRVHTVMSYSSPLSDSTEQWSTTTTTPTYVEIASGVYAPHHLGEDVNQVAILADIEQGFVQLDINGTTANSTGVTTRASDTATVTIAGGDDGDLVPYRVLITAQAGQTCKLYRFTIYEVVLTSGDLP